MAIGRISGEMLLPNLERDGVDLAIETDLLYFDVVNKRIGIKTSLAPVYFNGSITSALVGSSIVTTMNITVPPLTGALLVDMSIFGSGVLTGTRIISGASNTWIVTGDYTTVPLTNVDLTARFATGFDLVIGSATKITNTTQSESCETGALVVAGGVGIGKDLNVCGDVYIKGAKVLAGVGKRKTYSFDVPPLNVGEVYYNVATLGYSNIVYNLSVTAPVKVEVYSTSNYDDANPYTFLPTTLHQTDDGTTYFTDGTKMRTRQYSILANLEVPPTKNIYFKITGIGDVFGGTPLSDLAATSFNAYIVDTTLHVVGEVIGRLVKGMSITLPLPPTSPSVLPDTQLVNFVGSSWQLNVFYNIGTQNAPVVMTANYYVAPGPALNVTFYGYIAGYTLVVTSGLSTSLVLNMSLSSTDPSVSISQGTLITAAVGSIWEVSQTQTVGTALDPIGMQARVLVNTLSMIYIDEASDGGAMTTSVVSVLPYFGYEGETVFRSADKTYWIFSGTNWNQIL